MLSCFSFVVSRIRYWLSWPKPQCTCNMHGHYNSQSQLARTTPCNAVNNSVCSCIAEYSDDLVSNPQTPSRTLKLLFQQGCDLESGSSRLAMTCCRDDRGIKTHGPTGSERSRTRPRHAAFFSSGFSGYIWLDTKIVLKKMFEIELFSHSVCSLCSKTSGLI